jgi:hypothetical protein
LNIPKVLEDPKDLKVLKDLKVFKVFEKKTRGPKKPRPLVFLFDFQF